jgi:hypothetical protein
MSAKSSCRACLVILVPARWGRYVKPLKAAAKIRFCGPDLSRLVAGLSVETAAHQSITYSVQREAQIYTLTRQQVELRDQVISRWEL